ncbi:hypothetical protein FH972_025170 [Carpinus fangiana]|uniref:Uncharacterized protein n=1 Tax=Carpinus fangiana TaxID=176857 RepID=A0A5N6L0T2_9ROSI|nr:hypothetical protein FH972_025170 [Carpinus fangiana]
MGASVKVSTTPFPSTRKPRLTRVLGYWGYRTFENDHDLDLVLEIEDDAGRIPLHLPENSEQEAAAKHALGDGGLYHRLIERYQVIPPEQDANRLHKTVLLTAIAMGYGVDIDTHRANVQQINKKLGVPAQARAEMKVALEQYHSGTPLDIGKLSGSEMEAPPASCALAKRPNPPAGLHVTITRPPCIKTERCHAGKKNPPRIRGCLRKERMMESIPSRRMTRTVIGQ